MPKKKTTKPRSSSAAYVLPNVWVGGDIPGPLVAAEAIRLMRNLVASLNRNECWDTKQTKAVRQAEAFLAKHGGKPCTK